MEELNKRLKKNKTLTMVSAILLVVFIVLTIVGLVGDKMFLMVVGFFGFCAFLGITYGFTYYKKLIKRSYCPACGTHYQYNNDISWEEISRTAKQLQKKEQVVARVQFNCKCPSCKQEQNFGANFVIYEHDFETGKEKVHNLHDYAKKYFV